MTWPEAPPWLPANNAVPVTAMPIAAPMRCAVISIPPAVPASRWGTEPSTKSVTGSYSQSLRLKTKYSAAAVRSMLTAAAIRPEDLLKPG